VRFWFAFVAQHILKGRQHGKSDNTMSGKKKNNPLPASSAGLLRFFEDETEGVKIKPEIVLATSMGLRRSRPSSAYYSGRFFCMALRLSS
jgi:preprotein translocase subunit Sec61beta